MDERIAAKTTRQDFQGLVGPAVVVHSPWRIWDGGTSSFLKERKGKVLPLLYYGIYIKKMVFFFFGCVCVCLTAIWLMIDILYWVCYVRTLKWKLIEMDWIGLEFKHIFCLLGLGLGEHFHFQFHGMWSILNTFQLLSRLLHVALIDKTIQCWSASQRKKWKDKTIQCWSMSQWKKWKDKTIQCWCKIW